MAPKEPEDWSMSMQFNRRSLKIAGIVVAAILVILFALPMFINVDSFRPKIESALTEGLGRQVTLGKLSLSILTGTVGVEDVKIADDPAFSKSPFVTAKSLKVGVELLPLIFSKQLNVTGIVLDSPEITLLSAPNGTWNFSSLGGKKEPGKTPEAQKGAPPALSVERLEIKDGKLMVGKANSSAKPQVYDKLNAEIKNFSATSQFPFEVSLNMPGGGSASVAGKAGPINAQDAAKTPLEATVKVKDLDIAKSGFIEASSGFGGLADFEGKLNSDGKVATASGVINLDKVKLSPKGSPAPKAIKANCALNLDLGKDTGTVTQGDISLGKAQAKLTGGFQTQGETPILNMKLRAPGMSVDELETFLPAMGVTLPSGSKLSGGTLSADLAITGPLDKLVIAGPVRMSNAKLQGFDMGSKLSALSAFSGKAAGSTDTTIQNASLNARIAPEMTRADNIDVTIPSLGKVTGAGTINPAGALDFKMLADLTTQRSDARADRRGVTGGPIGFMIQGTTSNPSFVPDVGSMAAGAAKGAIQKSISGQTGKTGLGGIFRKK